MNGWGWGGGCPMEAGHVCGSIRVADGSTGRGSARKGISFGYRPYIWNRCSVRFLIMKGKDEAYGS